MTGKSRSCDFVKELQQGVFFSLHPIEGHLYTKLCRAVTLWERLQKFSVVPGDTETVHNTPPLEDC